VADQSQTGSGLGLAIAKAVADSHGGTLDLSGGADGRGLRVVLTLSARLQALKAAAENDVDRRGKASAQH
jgi:signal transduction histidine kinase